MDLELEVAREIQALQSLDLDKLSGALRKLPMPTKFTSRGDSPENYHLCSDQELLDTLLALFERFHMEEDFGLWSTVGHAIELFEDYRVQAGLITSFLRQPMWKTAELAAQYCTKNQIEELIRHCQEIGDESEGEIHPDYNHIITILEESLAP